jgi:hypothetical protein
MLGVGLDGTGRDLACSRGLARRSRRVATKAGERLDDHSDNQARSDGNRMARPGPELGELAGEKPVETGGVSWTHVGSAEIA